MFYSSSSTPQWEVFIGQTWAFFRLYILDLSLCRKEGKLQAYVQCYQLSITGNVMLFCKNIPFSGTFPMIKTYVDNQCLQRNSTSLLGFRHTEVSNGVRWETNPGDYPHLSIFSNFSLLEQVDGGIIYPKCPQKTEIEVRHV